MRKLFVGICIVLLSLTAVLAYTPNIELKERLDVFNKKLDTIIDSQGELYRNKITTLIEVYKIKYQDNEKYMYMLTYVQNHINRDNRAPNILLIIADDMGLDASPWYSDYKGEKPKTPILDSLAENGLVFDNVWSNPLCSPTRSTILTGKYGFHTGVVGALSKKDAGVSTSEYSLQKLITEKSSAGYDQAVIGKWHLATNNNGGDDNPNLMGVPYYSGYISGAMSDYNNWNKTTNGVTTRSTTYATTEFTDDSISWVSEVGEKPWFLWLAYTAPHTPFHMPPKDILSSETKNSLSGTQSDIKNNPLPYYLASIEAMDSEIGRFLEKLPEAQRENTIIIFIGDNGTPAQVTQTPFEKGKSKGSVYRGGVHVPMLVSGKGIASGRASEFVNTSDLYTTIAELTGIILPIYGNSISFAPVLFGAQRENTRDYLYAEISSPNKKGEPSAKNGWTLRKEGYQFISLDNGIESLFADSDLGQTNNIINTFPDIASKLRELGMSLRGGDIKSEYGQYPTDTNDIICHDFTDISGEYEDIDNNENIQKEEDSIQQEEKYELGDGKISTSPKSGYIYACNTRFGGGGSWKDGDWIVGDYWYPAKKNVSVSGDVNWDGNISFTIQGDTRIVSGNGVPGNHNTGVFPVSKYDDAYNYDRNPNSINEYSVTYSLPKNPVELSSPRCVGMGTIGVSINGIALFNGLDARGKDAVAHEIQDECEGHPERDGTYHYHHIGSCLENGLSDGNNGESKLVGYALDGFGIYGNEENGKNLTNDDLDECHGHSHEITWDGVKKEMFHYHATPNYPYIIGCFKGKTIQ